MKFLISSFIVLLLLTGCTGKTVYVDRPVPTYIPQICKADVPVKPKALDNGAMNMDLIESYIKDLEAFVKACTKGG